MLIGVATPAQARDRDRDDKCAQNVGKAEVNLRNAIQKHGERKNGVSNSKMSASAAATGTVDFLPHGTHFLCGNACRWRAGDGCHI